MAAGAPQERALAPLASQELVETLFTIRVFEEQLMELCSQGKIQGTVHACIGQESTASVILAARRSDYVISNHRGHGHFIAHTHDTQGLILELMGKAGGVCAGRGGTQHLHKGSFYSNGVQGGMVSFASGIALGSRLQGRDEVVLAMIGDGTLGQGSVYEAFNFASLRNLPVFFVLENNRYAMSTRCDDAVAGDMTDRARAFGLEADRVDGFSHPFDLHGLASEIIGHIRSTNRPHLLVIDTYRHCGHSRSDGCTYRSTREEEDYLRRDCIQRILASDEKAREIYRRIEREIEAQVTAADEAPFPSMERHA